MTDIKKVLDGMTGSEAAQLLYDNDNGINNDITQLSEDVAKANFISSDGAIADQVNSIMAELFIGNGNPQATYTITGFAFSLTNARYRFFLYENDVLITTTDYTNFNVDNYWNIAIPITITDESDKYGYIVFNKVSEDYDVSSVNLVVSNRKLLDLAFSPIILDYITHTNKQNIDILTGNVPGFTFTGNADFNLRIKELYIPGFLPSWKLRRLYVQEKSVRLFISNDTVSNSIVSLGFDDIGPDIYGKIITLYRNGTPEIVGYVILERYGDVDYLIDLEVAINENVLDISKSPKIKAFLEADQQLVLLGDSLFGYTQLDNVLKEFVIFESGVRVYNAGFGGCRMSWQTPDGSSEYDKFTIVGVADAVDSGDYSAMEAANTALSGMYNWRLADFKNIDWSKPTTIICNYCNNDISGSVPIGDLWEYQTAIDSFDKTTLLGAMNYGFAKILTKYPHIKFVFLTELWRYKTDRDGSLVPPYKFINSLGISSQEYEDQMINNCWRLGVSIFNALYLGGRNAYNLTYMLTDNTHFNYNGYRVFAKKLAELFKSEYN